MFKLDPCMFEVDNLKVSKFTKDLMLELPDNPMHIAANMETVLSGETFIIQLNPDGSFDRTFSTNDYNGIAAKVNALDEARRNQWPIKVEDMENYSPELRQLCDELAEGFGAEVCAHLFIGFEGKGSFGWHTDEGVVACYVLAGEKFMETTYGNHILKKGDWLIMPDGLPHRATNMSDTVMLSFGTGSVKPALKETTMWASSPYILE